MNWRRCEVATVKVSELKAGSVLDRLVCGLLGLEYREGVKPSSSWQGAGVLVDHYKLDLTYSAGRLKSLAYQAVGDSTIGSEAGLRVREFGSTYPLAICKAVVRMHYGPTVEIPDELEGRA